MKKKTLVLNRKLSYTLEYNSKRLIWTNFLFNKSIKAYSKRYLVEKIKTIKLLFSNKLIYWYVYNLIIVIILLKYLNKQVK